jgi:hypothetical protein
VTDYAFDELGWLQFERLCLLVLAEVFELGELTWLGAAGGDRTAIVEAPVALPGSSRPLPAPVNVQIVWAPPASNTWDRARAFVDRLGEQLWPGRGVLVLTNLPRTTARDALKLADHVRGRNVGVLGCAELGRLVDERAALRIAMPSVLGLRDVSELIAPELAERSVFDLDGARALARVFWPTAAYDRARAVLARHRFVVLTGPPEMGKTAIARMLALGLMTDGWEARECTRPEEVFGALDPSRRQVFVADDAFGSTEYMPDAGERWAQAMGRLLPRLDERHWLIWTSRPAPLKAGLRRVQRERGAEHFPSPGEVTVDASDLTLAEKALILFRHAKASDTLDAIRGPIKSVGADIVEHAHFTPERIRRLVALAPEDGRSRSNDPAAIRRMFDRLIATPTDAMRNSYRALGQEHRELLISLLDAPAGLIDERELAATVRRHWPGGLSRPPGELIDRLTDHFLRVTSLGIGWVHPSWRDLVIDELRTDAAARERFLRSCGIDGVLLAVSREGGVAGERQLPLLLTDRDWDTLADRCAELLRELEDADLARLLTALGSVLGLGFLNVQARVEGAHLAESMLAMATRCWCSRKLPVALIESWYGLRARLGAEDQLSVAATWIELHPGSPAAALELAQIVQLDEWLALAEILEANDLPQLSSFRFHNERALLARWSTRFVGDRVLEHQLLIGGVLARMGRLFPDEFTVDARIVDYRLAVAEEDDARWWTPGDIAAPPSSELVAEIHDFGRSDVRRVLEDL